MAWRDTLLDAAFRGVRFACQSVSDSIARDVQRHAYPYVSGEDTEDLGRTALEITVQALFWGDDYERRLQAFVKALEAPGAGELIHPILGSIEHAQVLSWNVEHGADDPDSCRVSIRFCQSTTAAPLFVRQLPEQKAARARAVSRAAQGAGIEAFARRVQNLTGDVRGMVNRANGLRLTMNRVLSTVRGLIQSPTRAVLDVLEFPRVFTSDLAEGLRGLVDLRGFNASRLMPDWKGVTAVFKDTILLPASIKSGTVPPTYQAQAGIGAGASAAVTPPAVLPALAFAPVAALHPEDETALAAAVAVIAATELAETAGDVLVGQVQAPSLSAPEIEAIVGDVRLLIQTAIDLHRDGYPIEIARPVIEPLKDLALAIQEAGIAVIDVRPPLARRRVDAATSLPLLAFAWYADYTRAQELARLNPSVRHPNFIEAGEVLYAYQR